MTKRVPNADRAVTGLWNNSTDNHIKNALLAVLTTLKKSFKVNFKLIL